MKWLLKATIQKAFSALPNGEELNYYFQRNITKSLPISDEQFLQKFSEAFCHWKTLSQFKKTDNLSESVFYEFGAGQDLIIPFSYWVLGIRHQMIIDASKKIRLDLLNDTINKFLKHEKRLKQIAGRTLNVRGFQPLLKKSDLLNYFGINYTAPTDARKTCLPSNSFDFMSNTLVLEHIPASDISSILKECYRVLKPGGIMSCIIDMKDHYSYFDAGISIYNFLKFQDTTWNFINSSLNYQNRLRYSDYINLFCESGFEILSKDVYHVSLNELDKLKSIKIIAKFREEYSSEELGIKSLHIVSKKV